MCRIPGRPLLAVVALVVTACSGTTLDEAETQRLAEENRLNDFVPADVATEITVEDSPAAGLRGVQAGGVVPPEFLARLRAFDPGLTSIRGAAEAYDAVVLAASATEEGRKDAPGTIAEFLPGASKLGTLCIRFDECRTSALESAEYDYDGLSGGIEMLDNGEAGESNYRIVEFTSSGSLRVVDDVVARAERLTGTPVEPDPRHGPRADGVLTIGTLLPLDGPDPEAARAALAGVALAVEDINAEGGVLDREVVLLEDLNAAGGEDEIAAAVDAMIDGGVDVIVGGTTVEITEAAFRQVVDAGIVLISPTDSDRSLSALDDRGLFFRTAASDDLEGTALATAISNQGFTNVAMLIGTRAEDLELADDLRSALNSIGAGVELETVLDEEADLDALSQDVLNSELEVVAILADPTTTAEVIEAMTAAGVGPSSFPVFAASSTMTSEVIAILDENG